MLYHREVCWKPQFDKQINKILDDNYEYIFSKHLKNRKDFKHNIDSGKLNNAIKYIRRKHIRAFECETINNKVIKFAIRIGYNKNKDISIVFLERNNDVMIKTCWLNDKVDKHKTLDYDKYERR